MREMQNNSSGCAQDGKKNFSDCTWDGNNSSDCARDGNNSSDCARDGK